MQATKVGRLVGVAGEVTEVELAPQGIVVHAHSRVKGSTKEVDLGVKVTHNTSIKEGHLGKGFGDIRIGDRVWLRYEQKGDTLIAESIRIKGHEE
jgi:hypothetical protein